MGKIHDDCPDHGRMSLIIDLAAVAIATAFVILIISWGWGRVQYDRGYHQAMIDHSLGRVTVEMGR